MLSVIVSILVPYFGDEAAAEGQKKTRTQMQGKSKGEVAQGGLAEKKQQDTHKSASEKVEYGSTCLFWSSDKIGTKVMRIVGAVSPLCLLGTF